MDRFSEYRVMWVLVFFDLPTETKKDRKAAADFRKRLISDGFIMFQFSIYMRHCPSAESGKAHINRVKSFLPQSGQIGIITITNKQFASMELFVGKKTTEPPHEYIQLELFCDYSGINVPLVAVCNVPPVAQRNVPPQKWLQ